MANPAVNTTKLRSLRGLTPFLAAGKGTGDFGAVATANSATMTISDGAITPNMVGFATIIVSADDDIVISKVVCGSKQIVITVRNMSGGNLTAGNTTIAYFCIASEND